MSREGPFFACFQGLIMIFAQFSQKSIHQVEIKILPILLAGLDLILGKISAEINSA
jgi:hypothetical protein